MKSLKNQTKDKLLELMVVVKWHDARFFPGIYTKEACEDTNMCLFESLGYIITKDKITMRIAAERNNEGDYRDITLIPTGSILSIRKLVPRKKLQGGTNVSKTK